MATCPACGSELTGPYCDLCGARASEERRARRPRGQSRPEAPAQGPGPGLLPPQRAGRTTAAVLLAAALFGAGVFTGMWIAQGSAAPGTGLQPTAAVDQAAIDAMTPLAQANYFMETGVAMLNQGQRSAAVSEFRKSVKAWQTVLEAEPDNLFARTYLGLTYHYAGDTQQAQETLLSVLDRDPNYLWAIFNLAWIYETGDQQEEALQMYQRYLDVADAERQNTLKYAEQIELIDRQVGAAREAVARLGEGGNGQ